MISSNTRNLSNFLRKLRFVQGLSFGDLARRMGVANISKTASRVARFEHGEDISADLLGRVIEALGADPKEVRKHAQMDRDAIEGEFRAWTDQPVKPVLVERLMVAVHRRVPLPDDTTDLESGIEWAKKWARDNGRKVRLEWSRRDLIWINEKGEAYGVSGNRPQVPDWLSTRLSA